MFPLHCLLRALFDAVAPSLLRSWFNVVFFAGALMLCWLLSVLFCAWQVHSYSSIRIGVLSWWQ